MQPAEIVLPWTKPETEWVAGRALRKVSPTRNHSRIQGQLLYLLLPWARGRGEVGPEWRFRVQPPGESRRPLVPDIAFVSGERLRGLTDDEMQIPALAPTVAVEVLSPRDRPEDLASKIEVYLAAGTSLVIVADPRTRTLALYDGNAPTLLGAGDVLRHAALPDFTMDVGAMFAAALERRF